MKRKRKGRLSFCIGELLVGRSLKCKRGLTVPAHSNENKFHVTRLMKRCSRVYCITERVERGRGRIFLFIHRILNKRYVTSC